MDYSELIREVAAKQMALEQEQLERMCEIMLTTPDAPGISVQRTWEGLSCTTVTRLDPRVPFGTVGYLPDVHL